MSEGNEEHNVFEIKLYYKNKNLTVRFNKKDKELAFYIFYLIMENDYAYDPDWTLFLNEEQINYSPNDLIKIYEKNKIKDVNEFKIKYSDTESGENAYRVGKQIIWYPITEWKKDSYYYEKELKRWKNN